MRTLQIQDLFFYILLADF